MTDKIFIIQAIKELYKEAENGIIIIADIQ